MPGAPTLTEIERTLEGILKPLRDQLAVIDNEIATLDTRKAELREVRGKINRLLGANNAAKSGPKPKQAARKTRSGDWIGVAPEKIEALAAYITDNTNGEFNGPELRNRDDFDSIGISKSALPKALGALHERGTIRLVRQGSVPGLGNRVKVWAVTNRG